MWFQQSQHSEGNRENCQNLSNFLASVKSFWTQSSNTSGGRFNLKYRYNDTNVGISIDQRLCDEIYTYNYVHIANFLNIKIYDKK